MAKCQSHIWSGNNYKVYSSHGFIWVGNHISLGCFNQSFFQYSTAFLLQKYGYFVSFISLNGCIVMLQ